MNQLPRYAMTGRFTHTLVVLKKTRTNILGLTGVISSGFLAVKDVDEEHGSETRATAIAPEGRRGDLYPAELRARLTTLYLRRIGSQTGDRMGRQSCEVDGTSSATMMTL
jgi:hypothetical protein